MSERFAPGTVHGGWRVTGPAPPGTPFPRWPVEAEEGGERGELTFLPFAGPRAGERRQLADKAARALDVGGDAMARVVLERSPAGLVVIVPRATSSPERVDPSSAVAELSGLAEGLARLHAHAIVHGQVQPGNVVRQGKTLRLLPPGLFETSGDLSSLGLDADPRWAAPELLDGRPPSPAADCFSLGLVLFTLLTGKPPVEAAADGAALVLRATSGVPDLAAARPGLPAGLLSLYARLTAPVRARTKDGAELREELERCEKRTLPPPVVPRTRVDPQRVSAALIAALIAGGALVVAWTVAAVTSPGATTDGFAFPLPAEQAPL